MAPLSRAMLRLRRGEAPWMVRPTPAMRPSGPFFSTNGEPMRNLLCCLLRRSRFEPLRYTRRGGTPGGVGLTRVLFPLTLGFGLAACGSSGSQDVFPAGASGTGGATGSGGDPSTTGSTTGVVGAGTGGSGTAAGTTTGGGTTGAGGGTTGAGGGVRDAGGPTGDAGGPSVSVVQHHNNLSRDGVYVDARLTRAAA